MPIDLSHRYVSMESLTRIQRPFLGFQVPITVNSHRDLLSILHRGSQFLKILVWDRTLIESSDVLPFRLSEFETMGLTGLQSLECINCVNIYGSLNELSRLTRLRNLSLKGCTSISGDLGNLTTLSQLSILSLSQLSLVSGDVNLLTTLVELKDVDFSGCRFISFHMDSIAKFVHLETLRLNFESFPISMELGSLALVDLVNLKVVDLCDNVTIRGICIHSRFCQN
jgi:hypothetical protein